MIAVGQRNRPLKRLLHGSQTLPVREAIRCHREKNAQSRIQAPERDPKPDVMSEASLLRKCVNHTPKEHRLENLCGSHAKSGNGEGKVELSLRTTELENTQE